jgi:peptidoglycan/LPS O-acetylase OafA/YrhL
VRLLAVTIAVLICYRFVLAFGGATHGRLYNGPDTHADGLIAGAALAFFLRHRPGFALRGTLALAGASVGVWALIVRQPTQAWDVFGLPLAEAACVLVVLAALTLPGWSKILSVPPLRWFGRISYSLYLWHYMLIWAFGFHNRAIPGVLAVGVAYVSTRWVEEPIRQWRRPAREAGAVVAAAQTSVA